MNNTRKTPMLMGWNDDYDQHKEIIDEQHRSILSTINSIYYLFLKADDTNIIKHVMMLHSQLKIHFQTEILILKKNESPLLANYEKQADAFLDSLLDVCEVKSDEHQTQLLFEKFKSWWQSHLELHKEITPYLFNWRGDYCKIVA
ncbi:chemotaxis protein [Methylophaga sp.]|uniref:chemotaxis protein n=1 Tax=Methylophaga sp. TaxID=2024840 RepID=UPI003F6A449B